MPAFYVLFGLVCGIYVAYDGEIAKRICAGVFLLLMLLFALSKKQGRYILIGASIGALLGLIPAGPWAEEVDAIALIIRARQNYVIAMVGLKKYYVPLRNNTYQLFDFIHLQGASSKALFTHYESRFDFASYLSGLGVKSMIASPKASLSFGLPIRFKQWENAFLGKLSKEASSYYGGLLFSASSSDSEIYQLSKALGVFHLLSSSGILLNLFLRFLDQVLYPLRASWPLKWIRAIIALLFLPLGLLKPGICRVIAKQWFSAYFEKPRKIPLKPFSYNGVIGIALIAFNPYVVFSSGFLLSFGISYFLPFSSYFTMGLKGIEKKLATVFLIHVFLFPAMASSGEIHLFALPYSLLITPLVFPSYVSGYIGFLTVPWVGFLDGYASFILWILKIIERADLSFYLPIASPYFVMIYYPFLIFIEYLLEWGKVDQANMGVFAFISSIAISLCPIQYLCSCQVSFIDVGQGDAILLRDHDKAVLLDTGGVSGFDIAEETLIPYLRKQRVYHIDAIIASHHDHDHIGGVDYLRAHFQVGAYLDEADVFPVQIGSMRFENLNVYDWSEENDKSLVFNLDFMGKKWLFTGDAPKAVEEAILADHPDLDCDILKVGHHGSSTSTSASWLDAVTPDVAIISCGYGNKYGHPNEDVLQRLNERNIAIRRTDSEGTITYISFCL